MVKTRLAAAAVTSVLVASSLAGPVTAQDEPLDFSDAPFVIFAPAPPLPEHAGQGVGRALMEAVEAHWRAIGANAAVLWVLAGNARARGFYARLGWLPDGATGEYAVPGATIPQLRLRKHLD